MYRFQNICGKKISPKPEFRDLIKDQFEMYDLLLKCWTKETCSPALRNIWDENLNYTCGQCSITSFLVQDYFGGNVYGIRMPNGGIHSFNEVDGNKFDLTSEQFFDKKLDYNDIILIDRNSLILDDDKYQRYLLLKKNFEKVLKNR